MHLLLTERLVCPRCGPPHPLVLQVDRWGGERRVAEGQLGCANCRQRYPVRAGEADLRFPPDAPPLFRDSSVAAADEETALRLAALLGVAEGPGWLVLAGAAAGFAAAVARHVPDVEVVAVRAAPGGRAEPGVNPVVAGTRLPLRDRSARGIALGGQAVGAWLEDALRVRLPGARIVLEPAPRAAADALRSAGLSVLLAEDDVLVAV